MKTENILKIVFTIIIAGLIYYLYEVIQEPIRFEKERDKRYSEVIERLKKIRDVQRVYRGEYARYAGNWDELLNFAKYDSITIITTHGDPDAVDSEAYRDTNYVKVRDSLFKKDFPIDSLPYIPHSEKRAKFELDASMVTRGGIEVPVFRARDTDPFDKNYVLQVGSLEETTISGNWE